MQPNGEYHYDGNSVTEYPIYAKGGHLFQGETGSSKLLTYGFRPSGYVVPGTTSETSSTIGAGNAALRQTLEEHRQRQEQEEIADRERQRKINRRKRNDAEAAQRQADRFAATPAALRPQSAMDWALTNGRYVSAPKNTAKIFDIDQQMLNQAAERLGVSMGSNATMPVQAAKNTSLFMSWPFASQMAYGLMTNPSSIATAMAGGSVVDGLSLNATGSTWAENVSEATGMPEWLAGFTNPGYGFYRFGRPFDAMLESVTDRFAHNVKDLYTIYRNTTDAPFILRQRPNTLTRVIGTGTSGIDDAVSSGIVRGNPAGGITTAKILNRRHLPKLRKLNAPKSLIDNYASNNLTREDYKWIKENAPDLIYDGPKEVPEGVIVLSKRGALPPSYEEYIANKAIEKSKAKLMNETNYNASTPEEYRLNWEGTS